ncbi:hypothetical protein B5F15_12070 [Butyricicoccus pullicaecorum]|uniref:Uncharacterized protein n=1 Tax=Butyricicoccus pullicaecorum TaxID=501571 RepID=A0A1Y4LIF6_9FIRM|nr:hypothetical protein B5F15_12070 [Butyricicoccus pullicaecorum]
MIEQYGSQGAQISTVKADHTAALSALTAQNLYLVRSCPIKFAFTTQSQYNQERRTAHTRRAELVLSHHVGG